MNTWRGGLCAQTAEEGLAASRESAARVRIWTPNCLFRLIADRQRTAAKGLARLLCLLSEEQFYVDF